MIASSIWDWLNNQYEGLAALRAANPLVANVALTPQPTLPLRERGSKTNFLFPSPLMGEGLGVRVLKTSKEHQFSVLENKKQRNSMKKYDAIVFDFDGVLVESVDVKTRAFAALYAEYGDRIVKQVVDYHLHHGGVSRFEKFRYYQEVLLGKTLTKEEETQLGDRFAEYVENAVVEAAYVSGAYEFLENNYQSIPLFVASGTPDQELKRIISRRNMSHYFVSVHGSPTKKGAIIQEILTTHRLNPDRVLMVGDAIADYEGASIAGVKFIGRVMKYPDPAPFISGTTVLPDLATLGVIA